MVQKRKIAPAFAVRIERRDSEAAGEAMERHLRSSAKVLLAQLGSDRGESADGVGE